MSKRSILFGAGFFVLAATLAIGAALFAQSAESDFTVANNANGTVTITRYEGWDSVVNIPATIGGKAVAAIGKEAFARQENLTGVTIPDSVTYIGDSAFANNKLASVDFGKGLVTIGQKAFYDNNLASVTLPDTVKSIGDSAFSHNLLAKIAIPGFNTRIGKYAFARNKQLTSVTLGSFFTFDNDIAYNYDNGGSFSFTSFIEEDAEVQYRDGRDRTNDIGERGKNLFWDYVCNGRKAGAYTPDLKYRAPKKDGDFEYVETRYGAALTKYTGAATAVRLPEKVSGVAVKHLHTSIFEGKTVERVLIPNGVTGIGNGVFYNKSLTSVAMPDSVTYIGDRAFSSAEYSDYATLTSVTIGKNVVVIGAQAFYRQKLTSVVIPDSVTYIGNEAFYNNSLTSVTIANGVTSIGDSAFYKNDLTSVVIPDSVTYIGDGAFSDNKLTSVTIGSGVTSIGARTFYKNDLTSVVIPDSVTYIGDSAFYNNNLTSVTIGNGVTSIGDNAFSYNSLTSVTIGNGVTMGSYAIPCDSAYNSNGKKAGMYTREGIYSEWTYAER